jgi:hypothetical protein
MLSVECCEALTPIEMYDGRGVAGIRPNPEGMARTTRDCAERPWVFIPPLHREHYVASSQAEGDHAFGQNHTPVIMPAELNQDEAVRGALALDKPNVVEAKSCRRHAPPNTCRRGAPRGAGEYQLCRAHLGFERRAHARPGRGFSREEGGEHNGNG